MASTSYIRIEGTDRIAKYLSSLGNRILDEKILDEIGFYIVYSIKARTEQGKDYKGQFFSPYSDKYRLFRIKEGHPVNIVNLFFHGTMMNSLTHTVYSDRVEVFFRPTYGKTPRGKSSKATTAAIAYYLNEQRKFFALSDSEQKTIVSMIKEHIRKIIKDR